MTTTDTGSDAGFSVAETARRVGVAASTLRTWERRYGLQPSLRTDGGHRRYTVDDVAALQRLRRLVDAGLPTGSAAARTLAAAGPDETRVRIDRSAVADRFVAAVQAMDRDEGTRLAARLVSQLGVVDAWTQVFLPYLQSVGEHWAGTGRGVEREHLGTSVIQFALLRHHAAHARPAAPARVLAVATPEEGHVLPLDALAAAAGDLGIGVGVLGQLPHEGVLDAIEELHPSVVVVWARSRATADPALLRRLARRVPVVSAAGPGWRPSRLPVGVAHVEDLPAALSALQAWVG